MTADAFDFKKPRTRQQKRARYMKSTGVMPDPAVQRFARHLLLSNQLSFDFPLGEQRKKVSARQVLSRYSGEPDWGMDKGLDASQDQGLMGGTDPAKTSSQGFRHMSFLLGTKGQAPSRAQLYFDLGRRAIAKGHPYWGFRFTAWGLHYLEDMGTPVHTNMLPTLKYIRLRGLLRTKDASGRKRLNKGFLGDLVKASTQINSNYHFLYEHYVDSVYTGKAKRGAALARAVQGDPGKPDGWFRRLLAPRSVKGAAKRRAWSRLSTPSIARNAIRFFTGKYRQPDKGAASNTVRVVKEDDVGRITRKADRRSRGESRQDFRRRMGSRKTMMTRTAGQFQRNGVAVRHAMNILGKQIGKR